jgi:succinoglycan biosynthesis transport protein ExoP
MAQAEQKTLIIDADFRKPRQHEVFGLSDKTGLTSVLAGRDTLDSCLTKTDIHNLTVLTAGPEVPNPSEMLNSAAFAKLLDELKGRFDRIFIDTPPVMPVTDARILSAICDKTLLVLRAEKSTRKASQQARDGLQHVGANILGVIVNDVSKSSSRYGYYSGYGYGYGYGSGKYYGRRSETAAAAQS